MGFSGGGSNVLKPHTHDGTISQDGGALNMDGVTQGSLTAGDLVYSDGSNLQRLAIGGSGQSLTSSGTAPQWSAASGAIMELVGYTTLGADAASINLSFAAINITDFSRLLVIANLQAQGANPGSYLQVNGISTSTYNQEGIYVTGGATSNLSSSAKTGWDIGKWQIGANQLHIISLTSNAVDDRLQCYYEEAANSGINIGMGWNTTASQTSINEVEIFGSGGNLTAGSSLTVYRQNVT
jgi:hypothetical protein